MAVPAGQYFRNEAVVWDNGEDLELRGIVSIEKWMSGNADKYNLSTELISVEQREGDYFVSAVVSGDFGGSPYEFSYRFSLLGDRIKELTIDPIGTVGSP